MYYRCAICGYRQNPNHMENYFLSGMQSSLIGGSVGSGYIGVVEDPVLDTFCPSCNKHSEWVVVE